MLSLDWVEVRQASNLDVIKRLREDRLLDQGESEAIAIALEIHAEGLLIDEWLGRQEAVRLGLSITGVLGVLLVAKWRGLIPAIHPLLDDLIAIAKFRVSRQLYQEVLDATNEKFFD